MEYTQWGRLHHGNSWQWWCLNPCCNGIYSMSNESLGCDINDDSLNPCCNGIYSMRVLAQEYPINK